MMLTSDQQRINELMGVNSHQFIEDNHVFIAMNAENITSDQREREARLKQAEEAIAKAMHISAHEFKKLQEQQEACKLTIEEIEVCEKLQIMPVDYLAEKMKTAGITEYLGMKIK